MIIMKKIIRNNTLLIAIFMTSVLCIGFVSCKKQNPTPTSQGGSSSGGEGGSESGNEGSGNEGGSGG
jgi:hypothetical protein